MSKIVVNGSEQTFELNQYNNGGIQIQLFQYNEEMDFWEPSYTATVWVPGLKEDEVAIKDYSFSAGVLDGMVQSGMVQKPHRYIGSGYESIPVCKVNEQLFQVVV